MAVKQEVRTKIDILIDAMFQVQSSLARLNTNIERQLAQGQNPSQHYAANQAQYLGGLGQLVGRNVVGADPVWLDDPIPPPPPREPTPEEQARAREFQQRYRRVFGRL